MFDRLNRRSFIRRVGAVAATGGAFSAMLTRPSWGNENDPHNFGRAAISDRDSTDRPGHGRGNRPAPSPPVEDADGAPNANRGSTTAPPAPPAPVTDNDPSPPPAPAAQQPEVIDSDGVAKMNRGRLKG